MQDLQLSAEQQAVIPTKKARLSWLDGLRAFAMILAIISDDSVWIPGWHYYSIYVGPIIAPLFFAVAGFVLPDKGESAKQFFGGILKKLVIPWLFLSMIWVKLIFIPTKGFGYWLDELEQVLSGEIMWFMPALILAEVIFFFVRKICLNDGEVFVAGILGALIGLGLSYIEVGDYAMLNRAFVAQMFLAVGYICRMHKDKVASIKWYNLLLFVCAYVLLGMQTLVLKPGHHIDVSANLYPAPVACILMAVVGCFALFSAALKAGSAPRWLAFIGRNTLVYYVFHSYCIAIFRKILSVVGIALPISWFTAIAETAFALVACAVVAVIINLVIPEAIGKKRVFPARKKSQKQ